MCYPLELPLRLGHPNHLLIRFENLWVSQTVRENPNVEWTSRTWGPLWKGCWSFPSLSVSVSVGGGTTCLQLLGLKHKLSKSNRKMSCKTTFKSCETQIDGVEFSQKLFWALFIQKETWHRQRLRSVNLGQQRFRALQYHDARFPQDPPSQKLEEASQLTEN